LFESFHWIMVSSHIIAISHPDTSWGDLEILVANLEVCSSQRTARGGIPAIFWILLMGLERKHQWKVEFLYCGLAPIFLSG
jgi:hypothetical protein